MVYLSKTIALLELTGDGYTSNDIVVKNTFQFYWKNYNSEFKAFPIIDTKSDLNITLNLLENYYNNGYRYFVGFSRSTIVSGVLDWFNNHPEAIGISSTSTAPILNIPKKIYRMTPNDDYILNSVLPQLESSSKVYYIYTAGEVAMLNILSLLKSNPIISPKLITFAVNPDNSNLTVQNIENLFENPDESQSILLYLLDRPPYIDLYNQGLTFPGQQYDILGIQPPQIIGEAAIQLNNKYNVTAYKGTNTSIIWRDGYNSLGEDNYSIVSLNILNLLNTLVLKENVSNINSHFGILQFDPVSRDIIYPSFLVEILQNNQFINKYLIVNDPLLGTYNANLA